MTPKRLLASTSPVFAFSVQWGWRLWELQGPQH